VPGQVSKAQQDRLAALVDLLSPAHAVDRIDTFGKWLFGGLGTVGSLAVGFSVAAFSKPSGLGQATFVAAVTVMGVSLAIASWALAPALVNYNPNSLTDMQQAVGGVLTTRWKIVRLAAVGFALTLLLASLTPALDGVRIGPQPAHVATSYQLGQDGTLTVQVSGRNLKPYSQLEGTITPACPGTLVSRADSVTQASGSGDGSVTLKYVIPAGAVVTLYVTWTSAKGRPGSTSEKINPSAGGTSCG
jgi:hypothetical protein